MLVLTNVKKHGGLPFTGEESLADPWRAIPILSLLSVEKMPASAFGLATQICFQPAWTAGGVPMIVLEGAVDFAALFEISPSLTRSFLLRSNLLGP